MWVDYVWVLPNRILASRHRGTLTLADLEAVQASRLPAAQPADGPLHLLVDVTARTGFSPELLSLRGASQRLERTPVDTTGMGWVVVIDPQPHPVMRFIGSTMAQVINFRLHIAPSLDAALYHLFDRDSTLTAHQDVLYRYPLLTSGTGPLKNSNPIDVPLG